MKIRTFSGLFAALVAVGSLAFAASPIPGKWMVPDGGKVVRQRPAGVTHAFVLNKGPDRVIASSKGLTTSVEYLIAPDGQSFGFQLPAGAKNVKIADATGGNGLSASGVLVWASKALVTDKKNPSLP